MVSIVAMKVLSVCYWSSFSPSTALGLKNSKFCFYRTRSIIKKFFFIAASTSLTIGLYRQIKAHDAKTNLRSYRR